MNKKIIAAVIAATLAGSAMADESLQASWKLSKAKTGPTIEQITFANKSSTDACVSMVVTHDVVKQDFLAMPGMFKLQSIHREAKAGKSATFDLREIQLEPGEYLAIVGNSNCDLKEVDMGKPFADGTFMALRRFEYR